MFKSSKSEYLLLTEAVVELAQMKFQTLVLQNSLQNAPFSIGEFLAYLPHATQVLDSGGNM